MLRTLFLIFCTILLACAGSPASAENFGEVQAIVVRVVDGDTLIVDIPDFPPVIGQSIGVRVAACDTPEKRSPEPALRLLAQQAQRRTSELAAPGTLVMLHNLRRDKYFRLLADVECSGRDLASTLIQEGLAHRYEGGRKDW